jgi:hypothetical protein
MADHPWTAGAQALKIALVAGGLLRPVAAHADPVDRWASDIASASARFGIPELWIREVIRAESGGQLRLNGQPIVSRAGAMGLMQLMPRTWRDMRLALGLGPDPHDPADNILAGTAYLRLMYDRFGYPGLFAAYNAGPARYAAYLTGAQPLPAETRAYVATMARARPQSSVIGPLSPPGLFALRLVAAPVVRTLSPGSSQTGLFVVLTGPGCTEERPKEEAAEAAGCTSGAVSWNGDDERG